MLILTVTRQCNLRCRYCEVSTHDGPTLSAEDCRQALRLFVDRFGGGDVKITGGEPLLALDSTLAALAAAQQLPEISRVYLCSNGLELTHDLLTLLADQPKLILTVSLDGMAQDHDRNRTLPGGREGSYARATALLGQLVRLPRLVVTQTIAATTVRRVAANFAQLLDLGFRRFNLLPAHFQPWSTEALADLNRGLSTIAQTIVRRWERGEHLYLRNLFTWAPSPFFNRGLVVDADRRIYPSNLGLWRRFDPLRPQIQTGDLDQPPTLEELEARGRDVNGLLEQHTPRDLWQSTLAVNSALSRFCEGLYPALIRKRKRSRGAA